MSNNSTLAADGLFTQAGFPIVAIHGFGHKQWENPESWQKSEDGRVSGDWWAVVTVDFGREESKREYALHGICHDRDDEAGKKNMDALMKACMDYLAAEGEWTDCGKWIPAS